MTDLLQHPWVQIAAWALLHFVWQGAAIALAALLALRLARRPAARYIIGVAALSLMAAAPIITVGVIANDSAFDPRGVLTFADASPSASAIVQEQSTGAAAIAGDGNVQISPQLLGIVAAGWFCGLLFFAIRLAGGWVVARRLARRAVEPAAEELQRLAAALARDLGIRKAVRILQSSSAHVPMVIGWIAPAIVLPVAALSGLSAAQVEALLAHELAHIRRHDYLVNLLQSFLEVVLFYHPAVWWLSRQVRAERERCCDDLAVSVCDRLVYASALGDLAALTSSRVALAATDGDLLGRIRRILSREEVVMSGRSRWSVVAVLGLATAMMVPVSMISAGPARALEAPLSQEQQLTPQQLDAMKRMYDEMRARMADIEKLIAQTLGKTTHDAQAHAERLAAEKEKTKHADVAKHMELLKHAEMLKHADLVKHLEQMKHAEQADRDAIAKQMELVMREQERVSKETADHVKKLLGEQMKRDLAEQALFAKQFGGSQAELERHERQLAEHARQMENAARAYEQQAGDYTSARELYNKLLERQKQQGNPFGELHDKDMNPVADEKATVQPGDVLRITIGGEPDLPSMYKVATEGTIRVPFLGASKVVGLTAAQVREAIGRQLSDRRLGSASSVQVSILRPRK